MSGTGHDPIIENKGTAIITLPQMPSETPLRHEGTKWVESSETRLAGQYMEIAHGRTPPAILAIKDHDLSKVPELDVSHPNFERRNELRNRYTRENEQFALQRQRLLLTGWTDLYKFLAAAAEANAPILHRRLKMECDLTTSHNIVLYSIREIKRSSSSSCK